MTETAGQHQHPDEDEADGAVTLTVKLEFLCLLTVLGDRPNLPWTLL